jgi:hypothetical protein
MTSKRSAIALVIFATFIGLAIRLGPSLPAVFPLNDGGLFYAMMRDLRANGYALPAFAHYNGVAIPFAYPPLGFYVTSLLADLFRANLLDVMRWLPPLVSALTIPAFYLLARGFSPSRTTAALATLIFALIPRAFAWQIMGGGVTRSFGFLFAILTLACAHRLFTAPTRRILAWTSICAALTVLTHPEAATQAAFAALLLFLFFDRSRVGLIRALMVAGLTFILTAPWWGLVVARHGIDPFLAASSAVRAASISWIARPFLLFQFQFTEEPFLQVIAVLGLIGAFLHLTKRDAFLPAWLGLAFLFEPRSAPQTIAIPLSLLAATALADLILPRLTRTSDNDSLEGLLNGRNARAFFGFLFVTMVMGAYFTSNRIAQEYTLKSADLQAMQWVQTNTPEDSVFVIVTGERPLFDAVSEWFPVLADRVSSATAFGYEWMATMPYKPASFKTRIASKNGARNTDTHLPTSWSAIFKMENTSLLQYRFIWIRAANSLSFITRRRFQFIRKINRDML